MIQIAFLLAWLVGAVSCLASFIYMVQTVRHVRPGVSLWGRETYGNPFNVLIRPALLTEAGLAYRRKCFQSALLFLGAAGAALLMGIFSDKLQ